MSKGLGGGGGARWLVGALNSVPLSALPKQTTQIKLTRIEQKQ